MRLLQIVTVLGLLILQGGCQKPSVPEGQQNLEGRTWQLVELDGRAVDEIPGLRVPTLLLDEQAGQAAGISGVNRYTTGYTLEESSLTFGEIASTRMAGPPEAMEFEQAFLNALQETTAWTLREGLLELSTRKGESTLRFRAE